MFPKHQGLETRRVTAFSVARGRRRGVAAVRCSVAVRDRAEVRRLRATDEDTAAGRHPPPVRGGRSEGTLGEDRDSAGRQDLATSMARACDHRRGARRRADVVAGVGHTGRAAPACVRSDRDLREAREVARRGQTPVDAVGYLPCEEFETPRRGGRSRGYARVPSARSSHSLPGGRLRRCALARA
jgi:hypothetical protein